MIYLFRFSKVFPLLLMVCLLPFYPIQAQDNTSALSGYIKDANTGETLIAANIAHTRNQSWYYNQHLRVLHPNESTSRQLYPRGKLHWLPSI